jgi:NAD(P)-dependent dehydrogenase (short-subunit alcohol dehydrogenase family)
MAKVWLITGSGNGLGRDIAEAALAAGDSVVAGARRTEELAPLVAPSSCGRSPTRSRILTFMMTMFRIRNLNLSFDDASSRIRRVFSGAIWSSHSSVE